MENNVVRSEHFENPSDAERDLLITLLYADEVAYPWNPEEPEAQAYFAELESQFSLDSWQTDELETRSQQFFTHLDQLWATTPVQTALFERFAGIPQSLLSTIARQAQQVLSTQASLTDQLVHCVREVLPNWAEEDLQVFARPYAFAMRGAELDSTADAVAHRDWETLPESEQVRAIMAAARYAITQVQPES